ncbi:delta-class carbonic anhydrase [Actibacterium ureilyticum]|uniref:delta-class carbonic anhydrase n=1 Tax=Actibacterium ureilyticum TaxID=1590614 RepID=UPI000BAB04FB|nr:delta-class carbonic anhydrase [Actibacterium ureilyticum]
MTSLNFAALSVAVALSGGSAALAGGDAVADDVITAQRAALAASTDGAGFGPQSPRDIDAAAGENMRAFQPAPEHTRMNLCNIHFHEGAEHKGGEFTTYVGNGDGKGYNTGFAYSGTLTEAELAPLDAPVADKGHGGLVPGDTIEVHCVHTTAQVKPGPTLAACLGEAIGNPQLRVETQVMVLVNDRAAMDFAKLAEVGQIDGYHQALNIPDTTGDPVQYEGSSTGPGYNETGSPYQVSWSVRPQVVKVDIATVATWLEDNIFDEDHAHGVRNLVKNPALLSQID